MQVAVLSVHRRLYRFVPPKEALVYGHSQRGESEIHLLLHKPFMELETLLYQ